MKLLVCLACCLIVVLPASEGSYRGAEIKRLFEDLMRDDEEKPVCMTWSDQQPQICADMLRRDPGYCKDYGHLPFCRRTCSPCGPKKLKPPAPAGVCEDKRKDCKMIMHLFNRNNCEEQETYAFLYCRSYCNICQRALGSVWKP